MRTCLRHSVLSASQARSRHERLVNAAAVAVTAVAHRIKSIIPTHKNYIILMCWKFILYGESMIRIRICGSRNRHLVCPVCTQRSPCNVALTYRWEKERKNEMICAYHLYPFFFFHFFLRFELQTAVFFRCVSVYVLCVCEICWINLMHARNGLVLLVCEGTFHGNERGFFSVEFAFKEYPIALLALYRL